MRLSVRILLNRLQHVREVQPELARLSKIAGLPLDETPPVILLWNTVLSLPQLIREHELEFTETLRAYDGDDAFLRVARLDEPKRYDWQGKAEVHFPIVTRRGLMTIAWDGSRITGKLNEASTSDQVSEMREMEPGVLQSPEGLGNADLGQGAKVDGIAGFFEWSGLGVPTSFTARRISEQCNDGDDVDTGFHRYTYRGGRFRGWDAQTQRISQRTKRGYHNELRRDSFDCALFGRRGRITQVTDDETEQCNQVLGVVVAGTPLDEADQHVLWLVLSFVAGNRVQPIAVEHFDGVAALLKIERLSAVEYGERSSQPPFDLRITERRPVPDFRALTNGFARLVARGAPLAEALHHLQEANTGYTQVELKNLLFCIHTLFEWWTDEWEQREIAGKRAYKAFRRALETDIDRVFVNNDELREAVRRSSRYAFNRVGAELQEIFFDSLGVPVSGLDLRALRRRNTLFHNGFLKQKDTQSPHDFHQELFDDARTLRTLAHIAILKLAEYNGEIFDYRSYAPVELRSGYP
jgi:hypothetical protein